MGYERWIAKRYLWSKRRHPFVGVVSTISVLGIAVGVAALIIVLAVMSGFDEDLKSRIIGTRAHVVIEKDGAFDDAAALAARIRAMKGVAGSAAYIEGQALVQVEEWGSGVLVRGVDVEHEKTASKFYQYLTRGTLSGSPNRVVVGSELAKRAHLEVGSSLRLATQSMDQPYPAVVEGIFSSGLYDYDANLVFVNLEVARQLFKMPGGASGVSVYLKDTAAAGVFKKRLHESLGAPYFVRTWMDLNRTLFSALKLEKMAMFLILALIVLVACLNIAGSLTILVMDKTKDIGVLKALGALPSSLVKIFAWDGLMLGLTGSGSGLAAGAGVCILLKRYPLIDLPREIYYIDRLPVRLDLGDASWVVGVSVLLSFLSALYPALMAGRLDPVKALRYE